jgi:hypothetical protein
METLMPAAVVCFLKAAMRRAGVKWRKPLKSWKKVEFQAQNRGLSPVFGKLWSVPGFRETVF